MSRFRLRFVEINGSKTPNESSNEKLEITLLKEGFECKTKNEKGIPFKYLNQ